LTKSQVPNVIVHLMQSWDCS